MSFEAVAAVLNHSQASPHAKLVLTAIAYFESEQGAWMSQATLAKMTNMSVRAVRRHIAELRDLHELDVLADQGQGFGARSTNKYFVILDCPEGCDRSIAHKENAAEVVPITRLKRQQYRTKMVAIEDTFDTNRGQKWSQ